MATRFYLPSSGSAPVNFNGSASWNNPTAANPANQHLTSPVPQNTTLTTRLIGESIASVINQNLKLYVSDRLAAQTISGTFSAVVKGLESVATGDDALQIIIRVMSEDGTVERAVLYAGQSAALNATSGALGEEWPITTQATRLIPAGTAISSYDCVAGDRLSIEVGYRSYDTSATNTSTTITIGDPVGTADFALTAGLTTALRPWVEFSDDLAFYHVLPQAPLRRKIAPQTRRTRPASVAPTPGAAAAPVVPITWDRRTALSFLPRLRRPAAMAPAATVVAAPPPVPSAPRHRLLPLWGRARRPAVPAPAVAPLVPARPRRRLLAPFIRDRRDAPVLPPAIVTPPAVTPSSPRRRLIPALLRGRRTPVVAPVPPVVTAPATAPTSPRKRLVPVLLRGRRTPVVAPVPPAVTAPALPPASPRRRLLPQLRRIRPPLLVPAQPPQPVPTRRRPRLYLPQRKSRTSGQTVPTAAVPVPPLVAARHRQAPLPRTGRRAALAVVTAPPVQAPTLTPQNAGARRRWWRPWRVRRTQVVVISVDIGPAGPTPPSRIVTAPSSSRLVIATRPARLVVADPDDRTASSSSAERLVTAPLHPRTAEAPP